MAFLLITQEFSVNIAVIDGQPCISPWFLHHKPQRVPKLEVLFLHGALLPKIAAP